MEPTESADFQGHAEISRVCSACGATVKRHLCHRNRYGEYICQKCQRDGVEFTWRNRLRHSKNWLIFGLVVGLTLLGLAVWMFYRNSGLIDAVNG